MIKKTKKAAKKTKTAVKIATKEAKPIGVVTHFYNEISVAIVKFKKDIKAGTSVKFKGATTDFEEKIKSMQYNHKPIETAKKGQEVGIKVGKKVREGDEIHPVE